MALGKSQPLGISSSNLQNGNKMNPTPQSGLEVNKMVGIKWQNPHTIPSDISQSFQPAGLDLKGDVFSRGKPETATNSNHSVNCDSQTLTSLLHSSPGSGQRRRTWTPTPRWGTKPPVAPAADPRPGTLLLILSLEIQ